jgi:hypothetical protein
VGFAEECSFRGESVNDISRLLQTKYGPIMPPLTKDLNIKKTADIRMTMIATLIIWVLVHIESFFAVSTEKLVLFCYPRPERNHTSYSILCIRWIIIELSPH